jgi:hypothetical protein
LNFHLDTRLSKPMTTRSQIAHHEAAHVVVASLYGLEVDDQGINLDAETSVAGARGNSGVKLIDLTLSAEDDLITDLAQNMAIICAGAASDAKITGATPANALAHQPGDFSVAMEMAHTYPYLMSDANYPEAIKYGLLMAVDQLNKPDVWAVVESIAAACLESTDGRLSSADIEVLLQPLYGAA